MVNSYELGIRPATYVYEKISCHLQKGIDMMRQTVKWPLLLSFTTLFFSLGNIILPQSIALAAVEKIDQNRIKDITEMLPRKPAGFGLPITERNAWKKLAQNDSFKSELRGGKTFAKTYSRPAR